MRKLSMSPEQFVGKWSEENGYYDFRQFLRQTDGQEKDVKKIYDLMTKYAIDKLETLLINQANKS